MDVIRNRKIMKKSIICILIIFCIGCNHNTIKYYDTGEIYEITAKINDSISHATDYFKNGNVKSEGNFNYYTKNYTGIWKEYYSDGTLKWKSYFENGNIVIDTKDLTPDFKRLKAAIQFENNISSQELKCNKRYNFRILIPNIHPNLYLVSDKNFKSIPKNNLKDSTNFDYTIKPDRIGDYFVFVSFCDEKGNIIIGKNTIVFKLKVNN